MGRGVLDYVGTFALRFLSAIRPHANPATREATGPRARRGRAADRRAAGRGAEPRSPHGTAGRPPPPRAAFAAVALLPRGRGPRGIGSAYLISYQGAGFRGYFRPIALPLRATGQRPP